MVVVAKNRGKYLLEPLKNTVCSKKVHEQFLVWVIGVSNSNAKDSICNLAGIQAVFAV